MGDLISRKTLMEDFRNTITEKSDTFDWLNMIASQPTAFDLESVTQKLEEKSRWVAYDNWDRDIGMTHKVVPFGEIVEILNSAANATNGKIGG